MYMHGALHLLTRFGLIAWLLARRNRGGRRRVGRRRAERRGRRRVPRRAVVREDRVELRHVRDLQLRHEPLHPLYLRSRGLQALPQRGLLLRLLLQQSLLLLHLPALRVEEGAGLPRLLLLHRQVVRDPLQLLQERLAGAAGLRDLAVELLHPARVLPVEGARRLHLLRAQRDAVLDLAAHVADRLHVLLRRALAAALLLHRVHLLLERSHVERRVVTRVCKKPGQLLQVGLRRRVLLGDVARRRLLELVDARVPLLRRRRARCDDRVLARGVAHLRQLLHRQHQGDRDTDDVLLVLQDGLRLASAGLVQTLQAHLHVSAVFAHPVDGARQLFGQLALTHVLLVRHLVQAVCADELVHLPLLLAEHLLRLLHLRVERLEAAPQLVALVRLGLQVGLRSAQVARKLAVRGVSCAYAMRMRVVLCL
eukprot:Rhum_TRINITY_DN13810_c0_g2::Rhum_TRINITY_DN13810_c0_g2_i1::g.64549::m.64549